MPGMEARAPERTETSRGWRESPNFLPMSFSTRFRFSSTCLLESRGILRLFL